MFDLKQIKNPIDPFSYLVGWHAEVFKSEGNVSFDREHENLVLGILKNVPYFRCKLTHCPIRLPSFRRQ